MSLLQVAMNKSELEEVGLDNTPRPGCSFSPNAAPSAEQHRDYRRDSERRVVARTVKAARRLVCSVDEGRC